MKAVILAAGASRRLQPLTKKIPKCLIKIGGKSILEHQLDAVDAAGIREAAVVVGYLKDMITDSIGSFYKNISNITFIENPEYASTNTLYSLYLAGDYFMNEDFIYFNGDVLFHGDVVKLLVEHESSNVLACDYKRCGEEEVKFKTDEKNRVVQLSKTISPSEAEGEFIGVAKFGSGTTEPFVEALEYHSKRGEKNLFFERAVEDILGKDAFVPIDVSHIPNIEIDFPEDLRKAQHEVYHAIVAYDKALHDKSR